MSQRGIVLLLLVTVLVGFAAIVQDYRLDGMIAAQRDAATVIEADVVTINAEIARLSQIRLALNGAAVLLLIGVAIYLGRALAATATRGTPTTSQMLRDLPPPVKSAGAASPAAGASHGSAPVQTAPAPAAARFANLAAAAELCVDLARVMDATDVPALLERTSTVLDAKGVVLWAADQSGALLRPSLAHGYSDKVLSRLRPLQVDSDNVTSLAFRSLQPQAINGASVTDSAAIAIPLLTASGCVGVLAAELKHNRPHADLLPVAKIIGAQLSTLIGPAESPAQRAHA